MKQATQAATERYRTRELSMASWPDFERFFSQGNGWDFCWCIAGQRERNLPHREYRTRAERSVRNRSDKRELVKSRRAHGILVYDSDQPVGWCRYGPRSDFPYLAERDDGLGNLWSISCFVVAKTHRRQGVAGWALKAALRSIQRQGGGTVEAYPISSAGRHRNRDMPPTFVQGFGPITAAWGRVSGEGYSGTVSMFEREGFRAISPLGTRVVMRKLVPAQRTSR